VERRRLSAALAAAPLAAALALSAPGGAVAPHGSSPRTLTVAIPGRFGGCDPGNPATTAATDAVLALVLPSAFTASILDDEAGDTAVIAQAEVVAQAPQTVDYAIASTARWPGGAPLTPADLVRTWRERRDDRVLADLGYRDVAGVRPTAAGTGVVVTFRRPYADWQSLFNLVVPAATPRLRCTLPSPGADPSMGPYALVTASPTKVTLRANPAWTGAPPAFSRVVVTTDPAAVPAPPDGSARVAFLPSPTLVQLEAIGSTGGYRSHVIHGTTVVSLDFAVHGPAALVPAVRGAVARLVDRAALVARLAAPVDDTTAPEASHLYGQGAAVYPGPAGSPVTSLGVPTPPPPGATGAAAYGTGGDPRMGAAILRAHGFRHVGDGWRTPTGAPLDVCLAVPSRSAALGAVASNVAVQLEHQGVAVRVEPLATTEDVARVLRDGSCTTGIVSRTGDGFVTHAATSWLEPAAPTPANDTWAGVDDPVVRQDAALASGMLNPDVAAITWDAMDARLWDQMDGLPLYSPPDFVGWTPSIAGVGQCDTVACFLAQVPSLLPTVPKP
jgi:peptide/nickel transport system substrate-binding protein